MWSSVRLKWHPALALFLASLLYGLGSSISFAEALAALQKGFGQLMASVGLLVLLGCMLGQQLAQSGAIQVLAQKLIALGGKKNPQWGIALAGILVGIPVFCDAAFVVLHRLNPALARQSGKDPVLLQLSLAFGLYLSHTFLIPTPGPLAIAGTLGITAFDTFFGLALLFVFPVLLLCLFLLSRLYNSSPVEKEPVEQQVLPQIPLWRALLPLLFPILLIALSSIVRFAFGESPWLVLGSPVLAIASGVLLARLWLPQPKKTAWVSKSVAQAGPILIITAMGGAFGSVIAASGLGAELSEMVPIQDSFWALCWAAYFIALLLKSAQGSSTSAMIVTASLLLGIMPSEGLSQVPLSLLALSIGAGALAVSHTNDSYFWVVSRMGRIPLPKMFKSWSLLGLGISFSIMLLITVFTALWV